MTGAELKVLRKGLGLSLTQAAYKLGVSARSLARWESGKRPIPSAMDVAHLLSPGVSK